MSYSLANNMEEFTSTDFHKINKPTASFSEINSNMELLNNFSELNQPFTSHFHGVLDYFSSHGFSSNPNTTQPPYSINQLDQFTNNQSLMICPFDHTSAYMAQSQPSIEGDFGMERHDDQKNTIDANNGGRKRKRKLDEGDQVEKPREVIHVRAKRGQATDSHSLAERVRRERINEKLRVLQDLVPGCYKTMGMAVMLDVIINYVRSLQNQIEFLSMKLSAASLFYDFNSPEAEILEAMQTTNPSYDHQAHDMERVVNEGYGGMLPRIHSTWPF